MTYHAPEQYTQVTLHLDGDEDEVNEMLEVFEEEAVLTLYIFAVLLLITKLEFDHIL